MKLIDLLVKELPQQGGWPAGVDAVRQNCKGQLFEIYSDYCSDFKLEKCDDWITDVVTKQQYEASLAASEGWIEWRGGDCPVDSDAIVEVRFRWHNQHQYNNDRAGDFDWAHAGLGYDIIAYRLHDQNINHRANDGRMKQDLNECIGQGVTAEWDGEGLPPVGCECEVKRAIDWVKCKILFISEAHVVLMADEECCWNTCACQFRPLRTEAEMAREKLAASLHIAAGASPIELNGIGTLYFKLADAIISGSVFGTTFKAGK